MVIIIQMVKNKLLVLYSFPVTTAKNIALVEQFSYLENVVEERNIGEIIFLSLNKTNCDLRKVLKVSKFKYPNIVKPVSLGNLFLELLETEKNWDILGEKLSNSLLQEIKDSNVEFYIFGGIIQRGREISDFLSYYKKNLKSATHISTRLKLAKIFLCHHLIDKLKLRTHHIVFDPQELNFSNGENYTKYHNYNDPRFKLHRLDSLQYFLTQKTERNFSLSKDLDFVLGASIIHESRMDLHNIMEELFSLNCRENYKILYQNKFMREKYNLFVDRDSYLELIKKAKYTLVLRAYEKDSFSASRFIESIYFGTIPLLWNNSNYHFLESFGFDIQWVEKNLVVSTIDEIHYKIETLKWKEISDFLIEKIFASLIFKENQRFFIPDNYLPRVCG